MFILIDNYDSFTYNIVQGFRMLSESLVVFENDKVSVDTIEQMQPSAIILSPGPGRPEDAGVSLELIEKLGETTPMLGICLGHQCIAQAFGAGIVNSQSLVHGRAVEIAHDGKGVFDGVPQAFKATRYNSLVVDEASLPGCIEVCALEQRRQDLNGEVMALRHKHFPLHGVQFHPESILSEFGEEIFKNFIAIVNRRAR